MYVRNTLFYTPRWPASPHGPTARRQAFHMSTTNPQGLCVVAHSGAARSVDCGHGCAVRRYSAGEESGGADGAPGGRCSGVARGWSIFVIRGCCWIARAFARLCGAILRLLLLLGRLRVSFPARRIAFQRRCICVLPQHAPARSSPPRTPRRQPGIRRRRAAAR